MNQDISELIGATNSDEKRTHKRYMVRWSAVLELTTQGVTHHFHGKLWDIAMSGATVYLDNNLPVHSHLSVTLAIPPKKPHAAPQLLQVSCRSVYCVLDNNGYFRLGLHFDTFTGNGRESLEKELAEHVALQGG